MAREGAEVLVLGVGNLLWADEGFGVRCAEAFAAGWAAPEGVEVMDGGTQGLALVNDLAEAKRILILDAVDIGAAPAELVIVEGDEVPRFIAGKKVSLHQTSMMEVLALAEFMAGESPVEIALVGCQPVELEDYGGGLTPEVSARVPQAVEAARDILARWGFETTPGEGRLCDPLMPDAVAWKPYEEGRPAADAACRVGDDRVLARMLVGED